MKYLTLLILLAIAFSVCGNLICENGELTNCKDCALINQNYVCDNFTGALTQYDPDCLNVSGCYALDPFYTYQNGRGKYCFPGYCSNGSCLYSCTSSKNCSSGLCISGVCKATCDESFCNAYSQSLKILPIATNIYLGKPTYVVFALISSSQQNVSLIARGPCKLEYEKNVTLVSDGSRYIAYETVLISDCEFKGVGSILLEAPKHNSNGTIHFLSYPTKIYSYGNVGRSAGEARIASFLNGTPVEVVVWVS